MTIQPHIAYRDDAPRQFGGILGVIGGMGPAATVDFLRKLVTQTSAECDQDHLPVLVASIPDIPDRTAAILGQGYSPLPAIVREIRRLEAAGATLLAIPCNTAHHWYDELAAVTEVEIVHIADAVCRRLGPGGAVGLLATSGTLASGFYQRRLAQFGWECLLLRPDDQQRYVTNAVDLVKRGALAEAASLLSHAVSLQLDQGAERIVLGCTEISVVMDAGIAGLVDSNQALAAECISRLQVVSHQTSDKHANTHELV
jgi:aspartate racemase